MIITIDFEILSVKYNQFSDNDYEAMSYARVSTHLKTTFIITIWIHVCVLSVFYFIRC